MDKMRSLIQKHTNHECMHSSIGTLILTVLASVNGLYSSKPPGGADRVTCVTDGSYGDTEEWLCKHCNHKITDPLTFFISMF